MTRFALLALALLFGCGEDGPRYDGLSIDVLAAPPISVSLESEQLDLQEGGAVKIMVTPESKNETEFGARTVVDLRSRDESLFEVWPAPGDRSFVLLGLLPGDSCMEVLVGGRLKECIPVRVRAQGE